MPAVAGIAAPRSVVPAVAGIAAPPPAQADRDNQPRTDNPRRKDRADSPTGNSRKDNNSIRTTGRGPPGRLSRSSASDVVFSQLPRSREIGPAFFEKRADTFDELIGRGARGKAFGLALQLRIQHLTYRSLEQRFGAPVSMGRTVRQPCRSLHCLGLEGRRRNQPIDEAEFEGAPRIKAVAKQHQLRRPL